MIPARDCFEPADLAVDGFRLRAARFAADPERPPRGVCVLLNGQTEFIEKYFEVIDELRGRGFGVAALDWRGQGGSSRLVPEHPLRVHIRDFEEYDDDLSVFMDRFVAPMLGQGQRPIALAHSMGGHILLNYMQRQPGRFTAAAFSAPMLMFSTRGQPRWLVRAVTTLMTMGGRGTDFVWGVSVRDPLTMDFDRQMVTSDPGRFQRTKDFLRQHPGLRTAGPTWGWVAAAYKALAHFGRHGFAEQISTPALIVAAGRDRITITDAARVFAGRMPAARYHAIAEAEHEILMERDVIRQEFWRTFDDFVETLI
jgi:lysophospholipase